MYIVPNRIQIGASMNRVAFILLAAFLIFGTDRSSCQPAMADSVRSEFLHAWNAYRRLAWGHDELRPLSGKAADWYGSSLCMTPIDAFDTMVLMGLSCEAAEAKQLVLDSLSFDRDLSVQFFETTIRLLGGLLSAYQLEGDSRFLMKARDLADRLMPAFASPTGMPWRFVNLRTGAVKDPISNPAEIGTCLLEFGTLSGITGDPKYFTAAKRAMVELFNRRSRIGLVGTQINVNTGVWVDPASHIGGMIDSYYEYLVKGWKLFGDDDCRRMWEEHERAITAFIADTLHGGLWYGQADMTSGKRTGTVFGSLEAFFPALLVLSGDQARAALLESSCYRMWNLHGIEPEALDYAVMHATDPGYHLRPEVIESAYYLYRTTGDSTYVAMGRVFFEGLRHWCRVPNGYAMLKDVTTKERGDRMESFFFAETMKYFYLLFAPPETLPFGLVVFNTEAHPLWPTGRTRQER